MPDNEEVNNFVMELCQSPGRTNRRMMEMLIHLGLTEDTKRERKTDFSQFIKLIQDRD